MFQQLLPAFRMTLVMMILTGLIYPGVVTGLCQLFFHNQANGSLITANGQVVGSSLIGQSFAKPEYFHGRPSAAGNGYDSLSSGGANLGPTNQKLIDRVKKDVADFRKENPDYSGPIPADLLTTSASGLDPHISVASAEAAMGNVGDALLVLSGHDTNLSNISGMLGLSWHLAGYQPDDTPPGGALIFSLWRDSATREYFVKTQYLAQTLDQMRNGDPLTRANPPASQEVSIPGCGAVSQGGCSWQSFKRSVHQRIEFRFTKL